MTPEELKAWGTAYVASLEDGSQRAKIEATALFNVSGVRGAGLMLLKDAVDNYGVNYLECFGPVLNEKYAALGFKDVAVYPFDRAKAPKGWNYERDGTPDYHIMRR
jgi:hypothetical protein